MKSLIIGLLISAAAIYVASFVLPDNVQIADPLSALIAAGVLALVNALIRPIVNFLTTPFRWVTLGLFSFVVNALMLMLTDHFVDGFQITGWMNGLGWAIVLSFAICVLQGVLEKIVGVGKKK